mmetsp:Transcript_5619/g.8321  ORF Transcript_5619/g.8321 Transcript_5619/m.8321 type:complete len:205 (-) Transcript_5619:29-643(-)
MGRHPHTLHRTGQPALILGGRYLRAQPCHLGTGLACRYGRLWDDGFDLGLEPGRELALLLGLRVVPVAPPRLGHLLNCRGRPLVLRLELAHERPMLRNLRMPDCQERPRVLRLKPAHDLPMLRLRRLQPLRGLLRGLSGPCGHGFQSSHPVLQGGGLSFQRLGFSGGHALLTTVTSSGGEGASFPRFLLLLHLQALRGVFQVPR